MNSIRPASSPSKSAENARRRAGSAHVIPGDTATLQRRRPGSTTAALAGSHKILFPHSTCWPGSLAAKAVEFAEVVKAGRTHLMDAVPVTLGQEFGDTPIRFAPADARSPVAPPTSAGSDRRPGEPEPT